MVLTVQHVTSEDDVNIAMKLRAQVFTDEQGFDPSIEIDELDHRKTMAHFLGKVCGEDGKEEYAAVARCYIDPALRKGKIGRVAVLPRYRGQGFGAIIMKRIEETLADQVDYFLLHAQYDKKIFYEKCGYVCEDGVIFLEEGVEHCKMIKRVV